MEPLIPIPVIASRPDGLMVLQSLGRLPLLLISSTYRSAVARSSISAWTFGLTGGIGEAVELGGVKASEVVAVVPVVAVEARHS